MATIETEVRAPNFNPIVCPGCKSEAAVSTKVGMPIRCPCGVEHVAIAIVVRSQGECVDPDWAGKKASAERAARAAAQKAAP